MEQKLLNKIYRGAQGNFYLFDFLLQHSKSGAEHLYNYLYTFIDTKLDEIDYHKLAWGGPFKKAYYIVEIIYGKRKAKKITS